MKITPFRQEYPHTCLPACIRMVLDYLGDTHSEAELGCGAVSLNGELYLRMRLTG